MKNRQQSDTTDSDLARYRVIAELASAEMHEYRITATGEFILEWVVGAEIIFGVSDAELQQRGSNSFLLPEERSKSEIREQAYHRGERVEFIARIVRPDGEARWIKVVNQPFLEPDTDRLCRLIGFSTDVTDQQRAARALTASEFRHRTVIELTPGFVCEGQLNSDGAVEFTWASPSAKDFFGCDVEEFNRLGWRHFVPAEYAHLVLERIRRTRAGQDTIDELPVRTSRGELRWVEMKSRPLTGGDGALRRFVALTQDITERRTNEELLRSQAFAFANMSEGVILTSFRGSIRLTNPACDAFFGVKSGELIDQCLSELPTDPPLVLTPDEIKSAVERFDRPIHRALRVQQRNGTTLSLDVTLTPQTLRGERFWLTVMQDVTERQALEREVLEITNREQQRIGSDLHDGLGQQLTGVALLLRGLANKAEQLAPSLLAPIEELAKLVNESIFTTRTLARGLTPVTFDRGGLAHALQDLAHRSQITYNIKVRCNADAESQRQIHDPVAMHLYRMAQEAIANAARHANARRIDVTLTQSANRGRLVVEDDGDGIDQTGTSAVNGTGMGLRIMRYRASMLGGSVSITNDPRGGTRVVCEFPLGAAQ